MTAVKVRQTVVKASLAAVPAILAHIKGTEPFRPPNSDMIEITSDGRWLSWAAPTGPLYRVQTRFLADESLSESALLVLVERVFDNNFSGGCSMDSLGNIYFSETATHNIRVLAPSGKTAVLATDPALVRPDGTFISADRKLYIPVKQPIAAPGRTSFVIYAIDLPQSFDGIPLGVAVTGL